MAESLLKAPKRFDEKYPETVKFQEAINQIIKMGLDGYQITELYSVGGIIYAAYQNLSPLKIEASKSIGKPEYQASLAYTSTYLLGRAFTTTLNKDGVDEFGIEACQTIVDCAFHIVDTILNAADDGFDMQDFAVIGQIIPYLNAIKEAYSAVGLEMADLTAEELAILGQQVTLKTSEFIKAIL